MISRGIKVALISLSILLVVSVKTSYSQVDGEFLKGGVNDGMKLVGAYISPFAKAFGAGFNSAWYNTAKTHQLGGFDITLSVSAGLVPDADRQYDLASLGFERLELADPSFSIAPTIAGENESGPALQLIEQGVTIAEFNAPEGTGFGMVPAPMLQAGIGMPLGSEIKLRYIPNTPIAEGNVSLIGGGLMHSVSQYIKPLAVTPFNISLFGGYSKLSADLPVDLQPENYDNMNSYTPADFADQFVSFDVTSWNVSLIGSVDIPLLTGFLGLGYGNAVTVLDLQGNIPVPHVDPSVSTTSPVYDDEHVVTGFDELRIEDFSGLRVNVGGRLKLGVFTVQAAYSRALYSVISAGIGVSFR
ncbi:MAG: hypothetical protein LC649_08340 [Bacteroidales bacterium]|nr:hypothetical protein [Bacteroidales bacterium]